MPRIARLVAIGYPHHITQKGNYGQAVFRNNSNYFRYLTWLAEYASKYGLFIFAYCLMPNHVHFIAVPQREDSLAKTFNVTHMRYSQYFNRENDISGHLWQGRFYSCALDERHLYAAIRYVENNPLRARLVNKAEDWQWSSAQVHLKNKKACLPLSDFNSLIEIANWEEYLSQKDDDMLVQVIKSNTLTGRPLGDETFISKLEKIFCRRLEALPVGRPQKK